MSGRRRRTIDPDARNQADQQFRNEPDRAASRPIWMGVAPMVITAAKLTATSPIREPKTEIVSPVHRRRKSRCRLSRLIGGGAAPVVTRMFVHIQRLLS
jgi:hypothetical protein